MTYYGILYKTIKTNNNYAGLNGRYVVILSIRFVSALNINCIDLSTFAHLKRL